MSTYTGQLDVVPDEFSLNVQTMIYDGREKPISFDWYGRDYDLGTTYKLHGAVGRQAGGCYEAHAIEYKSRRLRSQSYNLFSNSSG